MKAHIGFREIQKDEFLYNFLSHCCGWGKIILQQSSHGSSVPATQTWSNQCSSVNS